MSEMIPNWNEDLKSPEARERYEKLHRQAMKDLKLIENREE